jgi:hypothetical protein
VFQLVRLGAQRREGRLEEVVCRSGGERPPECPAEARRQHLRRGERGRASGPDAARAGDELAERPLEGFSGRAFLLALDERLAQEARDPLARQRPGALERRGREGDEVERSRRRASAATTPRPATRVPAIAA